MLVTVEERGYLHGSHSNKQNTGTESDITRNIALLQFTKMQFQSLSRNGRIGSSESLARNGHALRTAHVSFTNRVQSKQYRHLARAEGDNNKNGEKLETKQEKLVKGMIHWHFALRNTNQMHGTAYHATLAKLKNRKSSSLAHSRESCSW